MYTSITINNFNKAMNLLYRGLSQYGGMQSAVDIPSEINCIYNIDHQYENDSYPSFPEFNCISLQEDERSKNIKWFYI